LVKEFELTVKKRIGKLSKGMMSMVTIIVALASGADITLLDEPVAGLDVVMRERFYALLLENYSETGRTFVISTHIIEEAANIFEEVIILNRGKLLLKENTEDLVASFALVSGKAEDVDALTAGLECHHAEKVGRSKTVSVRTRPGDCLADRAAGYAVDIQPMNLQKVFVALCGEEVSE
ncbi:MAG: AAA family ATPase, partial [Pygmaiobacter sp.]